MEATDKELRERYETLDTDELVDLYRNSDLTELAQSVLKETLGKRGVDSDAFQEQTTKQEKGEKTFIDRNEFLKTVSIGKRFVHYIVDGIFGVFVFSFLLGTVFGVLGIHGVLERINPFILSILIFAVYYIFCEFLFNRTVGKLFTGSVVVTENGDKPSFGIVLLRTLIRFVPFEPFSILSASTKMWHDTWTKTTVVKNKSLK